MLPKIAYLHKNKAGYVISICDKPCNGMEFHNAPQIQVIGKSHAREVCRAMGVKPHNF